jgi:hypothetical protein
VNLSFSYISCRSRCLRDIHCFFRLDHVLVFGLQCPDEFVVGYGLDFAEKYRSLPYVGILKPEVFS